mmetsp:Transcript_166347/g.534297  ORF Transcript_166347/g.534297 Transcript_166347/m.534297 type:complete len:284 (+) Transcript_166347:531-1382(+)
MCRTAACGTAPTLSTTMGLGKSAACPTLLARGHRRWPYQAPHPSGLRTFAPQRSSSRSRKCPRDRSTDIGRTRTCRGRWWRQSWWHTAGRTSPSLEPERPNQRASSGPPSSPPSTGGRSPAGRSPPPSRPRGPDAPAPAKRCASAQRVRRIGRGDVAGARRQPGGASPPCRGCPGRGHRRRRRSAADARSPPDARTRPGRGCHRRGRPTRAARSHPGQARPAATPASPLRIRRRRALGCPGSSLPPPPAASGNRRAPRPRPRGATQTPEPLAAHPRIPCRKPP